MNNKQTRIPAPHIEEQLIKYLREVYPYPELTKSTKLEDIHYFAGVSSVLQHLESLNKFQQNKGE